MRYGKTLAVIIAAAIILGGAWWVMQSSGLKVVTKDVNYEATYSLVYEDGSSTTVKRYKTASVTYEQKVVEYVQFDLDAKFKATQAEDVRVLSPRAGGEHETRVTFYVVDSIYGADQISEYPLSTYTNTDYSVLDTGDWYNLFKDVKVTTSEIESAHGDWTGQTRFSLRTVVDVWYNLDPESTDLVHHELTFEVPFNILDITNEDPDDGDGGGGGSGDRRTQPFGPKDNPIAAEPPKTPTIDIDDSQKLGITPWSMTGGSDDSHKYLGKR